MEQHPIPQNISSYQFRLVGDMTLKQFFQLAGGFLVALIFYSAPLLGIIKWPLVIISVVLGIALAFLPLEERPLERWIFAFFRAIYSPTLFFWQKLATQPKFFQDEPEAVPTAEVPTMPLNKLDQAEKGFLSTLTDLFAGVTHQSQQPVASVVGPGEVKQELRVPEVQSIKITGSGVVVSPMIAGEEIISSHQAEFSVDAAPPNPPTAPNIVVGQAVDQVRRIVEGAIMEIKDANGRPVRALKSNKLGHFTIVTTLDNGKYDIVTEKDEFEFRPVSFEATGQLIPPILVTGRRLYDQNPIPVGS